MPTGETLYQIGDVAHLTALFKNLAGVLIDPTSIVLTVKKPSGTVQTFNWPSGTIVKNAVGDFHYDLAIDEAGNWYYTWRSSGVGQAAQHGSLKVEPNPT